MKVPQFIYGSNEELQRYFSLLTQQIQSDLSNNGWAIPNLTAAEVLEVIDSEFKPVLKLGTLWMNTDVGKLQFITVKAIPADITGGPLDATYETITSMP